MDYQKLFFELFNAKQEEKVSEIIQNYPELSDGENWNPYGDDENYFAVIENQQASPIPALVEKITNSIDAVLMKKCHELGIPPKSNSAPKSMEEAIKIFYPNFNKNFIHNILHL